MKRIVLFMSIFFAIDVYAQSPYVDVATVTADEITFEVDFIGYTLVLSNIANFRDEAPLYYKDGRELEAEAEYMAIYANKIDPNSAYRALREVLNDDVIKALRKERYSPMTICYVVDSDGTTLEVVFIMRALSTLVSLPPETFAALEKKLKQYVKWSPNELAKELRYFHMSGYIDFKKVPLSTELIQLKEPELILDKDWDVPLVKK